MLQHTKIGYAILVEITIIAYQKTQPEPEPEVVPFNNNQ